MVLLNDVGLTIEILGFVFFLVIPAKETFNIILESAPEPKTWFARQMNKTISEKKRLTLKIMGIIGVVVGLILQYSFLAEIEIQI